MSPRHAKEFVATRRQNDETTNVLETFEKSKMPLERLSIQDFRLKTFDSRSSIQELPLNAIPLRKLKILNGAACWTLARILIARESWKIAKSKFNAA